MDKTSIRASLDDIRDAIDSVERFLVEIEKYCQVIEDEIDRE